MASIPEEHVNRPHTPPGTERLTVAQAKIRLMEAGAESWASMLTPIVRTAVEKTAVHFVARLFAPKKATCGAESASGVAAQQKRSDQIDRTKEEQRAWNAQRKKRIASRERAVNLCIHACEIAMSAWRRSRATKRHEDSPRVAQGTDVSEQSKPPAGSETQPEAMAGAVS